MMATTHALAGLALASAAAAVAPDQVPLAAVVAAGVGGIVPDLDLYGAHRRTLHYPVYYTVATAAAVVVALLVPTTLAVVLVAGLGAAALHSLMDVLGGGLELRPWEATSERAVYDHWRGRWLRPRRWVRYDGAPEDLLLAGALAAPAALLSSGSVRTAVFALLAVSAGYALVRKPLVALAEHVVVALPTPVVEWLPDRLTEDFVG
jgi:hypothetical protein